MPIGAAKHGRTTQHIQPQQNALIERFNRNLRHEWLDQYIIESIKAAEDQATKWLWAYNNDRTNMGIAGITPAQNLKIAA
jgi:putative transposase